LSAHGTGKSAAARRPAPAPAVSAHGSPWHVPALAAALLVAVLAAHWPVLGSRALALDDDVFVVRNPLVQRPGWESTRRFFVEVTHPSTVSAYYLPLSMASLMLDWAAGGRPDHLRPFHATSVALHAVSALLLFLILVRLFGSAVPAALAALLWAVHPVMVEAIASAGERKTVLATALAFASVLSHVHHARGGARRWWWWSIAAFLLALLSKPSVITLPLALLVLDAWPLHRLSRTVLREKWPHFALAVTAAVISVLAVKDTWEFGPPPPLDPIRVLGQVVWLQGFYLGKLLWPVDLSTVYEAPARFAPTLPSVAIPMGLAIAVLVVSIAIRKRAPGCLAGGLVFFLLLAPTFAILRYSGVIAYDRYLHLPAVGPALALAAGLVALWRRGTAPARATLAAAMLALVLAAALATRAALVPWRDTLDLWRNAVRVSPGVPDAWNGLGATYAAAGRSDEATAAFRRAIAVGPQYTDAYMNLGRELMLLGDVEKAVPFLEFAAAHRPGSAQAAAELGMAYERTQRPAEAAARYRRSLELKPGYVPALIRLAIVEASQGRVDEGIGHLREALAIAPGDPFASLALAGLLSRSAGASSEVVTLLQHAIAARPGWAEPMNELAWLLATDPDPSRRDAAAALRLADSALAQAPEPGVIDTRAAALAALGRFDEAAADAGRAEVLARAAGDTSLADEVAARRDLYRRGRPFVQLPRTRH
jgi:protein O-mannosyl-transferase